MAKTTNTSKTGLTLLERVMLPTVLKKSDDYKSMIIARDLKEKVSLSQKEMKDYEVTTTEVGIKWNEKGVKSLEYYDLTAFERTAIKEGLVEMNNNKTLTESHISLYEKFIKP